MLKLKNVSLKINNKKILSNINLEINAGEKVALIGPSGSGKSSLIQLINGVSQFLDPDNIEGTILFENRSITDWPVAELTNKIGNVFQDPRNQFFANSVSDEINLKLSSNEFDERKLTHKRNKIIKEFKLNDILTKRPVNLSSGQKQTVAFAAATANNPDLLIMDEPSANLDLQEAVHIGNLLSKLEHKTTLIISEHRLFFLLPIINRFIYVNNGAIQREFTAKELKELNDNQLDELGLRPLSIYDSPTKNTPITQNKKINKQELLRTENVDFSYHFNHEMLLKNVSCKINSNEIVGLVGKNGVGKSTFAKIISGLKNQRKGKIFIQNHVSRKWSLQKYVWYVMQETTYQLFTDSVWNELFLNLKQTPKLINEGQYLLQELNLSGYEQRHPATLSGGEKQRLVLATALIHHPKIIILDEPSSGLDEKSLNCIINVINHYQQEHDISFFIISHDPQFLFQICDKIIKFEKFSKPKSVDIDNDHYTDFLKLFG